MSEEEYEGPHFRDIEDRLRDAWFLNRVLAGIFRQANDEVGLMDKKIKSLELELRNLKIVHENDRVRIEDLRKELRKSDAEDERL
jgi:hypothetical protein